MMSILTSYKKSLGARFSLFIGALLVPLFILTGGIILVYQQQAFGNLDQEVQNTFATIRELNIQGAKAEEKAKIEKLGNLLAAIAPAAIASYDFTSLVKYAQTAVETPGVCQIVYKTDTGNEMAKAQSKDHIEASESHEFQIMNDGTKMGIVVVHTSSKLLEKKIEAMDAEFTERRAFLDGVQANAMMKLAMAIGGSLLIVAGLTLGLVVFLFKKFVAAPVHESVASMNHLAEGNLDIHIHHTSRQDEIGSIAKALEVFKRNAVEREELRRHEKEKDETAKRRAHKITELSSDFDSSVRDFFRDLEGSLNSLESAARELTSLAQTTTAKTTAISDASQQVNESVHTVAQASEELSGSIREISQQINASSQLIHKTADQTAKTAEQSDMLMTYANKVNAVLELISNISHQTRLLSLNATIEAERAGDMGKGFAVVAGEVRVLASQTEDSVKQIQQTISDVQNASSHISTALEQTKKNVDAVNNASSIMSTAAEKQSNVTTGISHTMQGAAKSTSDVAQSIEKIAESVSKTSSACVSVNEATSTLGEKARQLRGKVEEFLQNIKTA